MVNYELNQGVIALIFQFQRHLPLVSLLSFWLRFSSPFSSCRAPHTQPHAEAPSRHLFLIIQPFFVQILPFWIHPFNQLNFLFPSPVFDLFFPFKGCCGTRTFFVINKTCAIILLAKSFCLFLLMLSDSCEKITGYPCINWPLRFIGGHVNIEHGRWVLDPSTSARDEGKWKFLG